MAFWRIDPPLSPRVYRPRIFEFGCILAVKPSFRRLARLIRHRRPNGRTFVRSTGRALVNTVAAPNRPSPYQALQTVLGGLAKSSGRDPHEEHGTQRSLHLQKIEPFAQSPIVTCPVLAKQNRIWYRFSRPAICQAGTGNQECDSRINGSGGNRCRYEPRWTVFWPERSLPARCPRPLRRNRRKRSQHRGGQPTPPPDTTNRRKTSWMSCIRPYRLFRR